MGAAHQKLADSPSGQQSHATDSMDHEATPPKCHGGPKRQLPFDPRSPTDNISRTPIIVDKTPDNILDPRSPTPGVERTPLTLLTSKDTGSDKTGISIRNGDTVAYEADMTTPLKEAVSPDSGCSVQDMVVDVNDSSPLIASTNSHQQTSDCANPKPQSKLIPHPKQLFPSMRQSALSREFSMPRSPLAAVSVDTNSPRELVQVKQRKQLTRPGAGFRGLHDPYVDKENVTH